MFDPVTSDLHLIHYVEISPHSLAWLLTSSTTYCKQVFPAYFPTLTALLPYPEPAHNLTALIKAPLTKMENSSKQQQ